MAKRKDSIALFEVVTKRRSDANLNVPTWMGTKGPTGAGEPPPPPPPPPASPASRPAGPGATSRLWSSIASGAGGQLTLKLSYTHLILAAAVLALVVILSVWAAYRFGLGTNPTRPAESSTMSQRTPLGQRVVAPVKSGAAKSGSPAVAAALPAATAVRIPGKYYLVIQEMVGTSEKDQAEAQQIAAWCTAQGEPATVAGHLIPRTGKRFPIVWSLRPFDSPTGADALEYGKKIETLGKTYKAQYKRYDFRQQRDGKFDPWYTKYTPPSGAAKK